MPTPGISVVGTRAETGARLERLLTGWMATIPCLILVALYGYHAYRTFDVGPLLVLIGVCVFAHHVVRLFVLEELASVQGTSVYASGAVDLLAYDLVRHLPRMTGITGVDLLKAAVATERGRFLLQEMGISGDMLVQKCGNDVEQAIDVDPFLQYAVRMLPSLDERCIDGNVVLLLFFQHVPCCKDLLHGADLSTDDLKDIALCEAFHHRFRICGKSFDADAIRSMGGMGRSWVMGYTDALDWLTEEVSTLPHPCGEKSIVIHHDVIESTLHVLGRSSLRNVLLLGKVGVGKRTLVRNVACALHDHEQRNHLSYTRILRLKTQQLLSGVQNPDAFFLKAFNRAEHSGNFLILIEDMGVFLRSASQPLKAVVLKFLQAKSIAIIGIADTQDYHTLIKADSSLDSLFEKVPVEDASEEETMKVLMAHAFTATQRTGITVTFKALKSIHELSTRYLGSRGGFPGKAIDVLDDVMQTVKNAGGKTVTEENVREVISVRSRVNVQKVGDAERDRLLRLEEVMQQHVIGQDAAVKAVANALKRARLDLADRKRPVGTFLFLGPTGVGKTQTAKVLAEQYFGSADALVRLDMNEYSNENSVYGIIGSPVGSGPQEGFLAQRIQDNPFSLILLDEIEKAHSKVLNVFLQILDEGVFNDGRGVKTDFRNSIIIATSNAGALFIRDYVKEHPTFHRTEFLKALLETVLRDKIFSPEFVNRFDASILFTPLSTENAAKVAGLMIADIVDDIMRKRGIHVVIEPEVTAALVERGYSVEFGARELRRTITEMIEDYLADYLLKHDVKRGETIDIRKEDVRW